MDEVRKVLFCLRANLSKLKRNPVVLSLALCWFSLIYDWCIPLTRFCFAVDARITPWLFPFLMQPHAIIIYVVLLTLFFAHAPFCNQHSPLTMIRMSKRTWFIGQVAYIAAASLMATLFTLGSMLLVLAPWLGFSINWGGVLQSLAEHTIRLEDYGLQMKAGPYLPLMVEYGPLEATVQTLLLTWLTGTLVGCIVLFFNILIRPGAGVVAGVLAITATGFTYMGAIVLPDGWNGRILEKLGILFWMNLMTLQPMNSHGVTIGVATVVQLSLIVVFVVLSTVLFCRRDTVFENDSF